MDHKRDTERSPESQSNHSSPKNQGAYYSLDSKKPDNGFKKWVAGGLLVMILAGGGYFASKKMVTEPEQDAISKQLETKKELIQSVLALQDDDYDDKAEKISDRNDDNVGKFRADDETSGPVPEGEKKVETPEKPLVAEPTTPEAAPLAETAKAEEDLRATEDAQRNQLAADSASMQTLTDEAVAREARAEEAIRKHKAEHMKLLQSYQNQNQKDVPVQAQLGLYRGILSKCYIHGHDVHWIDDNGSIIDHVELDTPLPGTAAVARNMIKEMGGGIAVIVYEKGYEVYGADGELIKAATFDSQGM